jgi:cell division protein ZapE
LNLESPTPAAPPTREIVLDEAQRRVDEQLGKLAAALQAAPPRREPGLVGRLLGKRKSIAPVRGLYVWGTVGRGKTMLMDSFFESLTLTYKMRSHFHRFMHEVHGQLKQLKNVEDPLDEVAEQLASRARVICFDEFFVNDIADAMILGTLFEGLFRRGVTLVATSNVPPDQLYQDGLQRQRFLPAIQLLETHTRVMELGAGIDYRLRLLEQAEIYHHPLDEQAEENLNRYFEDIAPDQIEHDTNLVLNERKISTRSLADGVVWFDFMAICGGPRSQEDYIELARCYHTVMLSHIPQLTRETEDEARRFIALVDEFYDRNVKLIVSAAVPLHELYQGRRLGFEFERTRSRLQEMQSREFLARPHLP